jgi:hypothetical protein
MSVTILPIVLHTLSLTLEIRIKLEGGSKVLRTFGHRKVERISVMWGHTQTYSDQTIVIYMNGENCLFNDAVNS